MPSFGRIWKWLSIGVAVIGAGCVLIFGGLVWFRDYMSEGVVQTATLQGDVLVALNNDRSVRQALLLGCHSTQGLPPYTSVLLSSGLLAEIPSGTKMHMPSLGEDRQGRNDDHFRRQTEGASGAGLPGAICAFTRHALRPVDSPWPSTLAEALFALGATKS
jgi:hypothetical protein